MRAVVPVQLRIRIVSRKSRVNSTYENSLDEPLKYSSHLMTAASQARDCRPVCTGRERETERQRESHAQRRQQCRTRLKLHTLPSGKLIAITAATSVCATVLPDRRGKRIAAVE